MEKNHSINFSCQNFSIENIYFSSREKIQWLTPYSEVGLLLFDKVFSLKNMSFWCTVIALYCALFWRGIHYQCSLLSYITTNAKLLPNFLLYCIICTGTAITIIHLSSVIFWDKFAHKMGYYFTSTTLFQREKGTTQTIQKLLFAPISQSNL